MLNIILSIVVAIVAIYLLIALAGVVLKIVAALILIAAVVWLVRAIMGRNNTVSRT